MLKNQMSLCLMPHPLIIKVVSGSSQTKLMAMTATAEITQAEIADNMHKFMIAKYYS